MRSQRAVPLELRVNGLRRNVTVEPDMPLLWVLREELGLTGAKYGCGIARCGACTVLVNGVARRSCVTPVDRVATKAEPINVTTIEGLAGPDGGLHPVQEAWLAENVPQCGYCQAGQVLAAVALLCANPKPGKEDVDLAMAGNLCRCGTYPRIRKAIAAVVKAGARIDGPPCPGGGRS